MELVTKEEIQEMLAWAREDRLSRIGIADLADQALSAIDLNDENERLQERSLHMEYTLQVALRESVKEVAQLKATLTEIETVIVLMATDNYKLQRIKQILSGETRKQIELMDKILKDGAI